MNIAPCATSSTRGAATSASRPSLPDAAGRVIMLLGVTRNTNNYGVRVLLSTAVAQLAAAYPGAKLEILDYGHTPEDWTESTHNGEQCVSLLNLRFSWKLYLPNNVFRLFLLAAVTYIIPIRTVRATLIRNNPWLRRIAEAEVHFSLAGGDSFSDIYRLERFFYVVLPQLLVLSLRRPLVLLPQTYGPFKGMIARSVAGHIFRQAAKIYSRDQAGVQTVKDIGGRDLEVEVVPDLGFAMEPEPVSDQVDAQFRAWRKHMPVVGLNISKLLYMGGYTGKNMFGLKSDYPALMKGLIKFLAEDLNTMVVLIPHVFGGQESQESELVLCRQLYGELKNTYPKNIGFFDEIFTHRQMKHIIGQCDIFSGARMHACIAAVSRAVPTIPLAYSDKFIGVMSIVAEDIPVIDLRTAEKDTLCEQFRAVLTRRQQLRQTLEYRMPEVVASIRTVFQPSFCSDLR